jgi:hypothetical protein
MFAWLKNWMARPAIEPQPVLPDSVSDWAGMQDLGYVAQGKGQAFSLTGQVKGKTWRLERGPSSRDFIQGEELRARADMGIKSDATVLVINRSLKNALEKKAYSLYTDSLQTLLDQRLPEEMRWLAMYGDVVWTDFSPEFWARYTVLADRREHAQAWIDPALTDLLMSWPQPGPGADNPFILMLQRGRVSLRMQYTPVDIATLKHAAVIFTHACEAVHA